MPSPINTGVTLMTNSSIACASRNEAMIWPPPINQISLQAAFEDGSRMGRLHRSRTPRLAGVGRWRMTGEDDAPTLRVELRPHAQADLVGLPAKHFRVNRFHKGVHAIETFWCRAGRQPFEIAVGTRDIAVRAGRDVDDDFATLRHECDLRCQEPRNRR